MKRPRAGRAGGLVEEGMFRAEIRAGTAIRGTCFLLAVFLEAVGFRMIDELAFNDLRQGNVRVAHVGGGGDQGSAAIVELGNAAGNHVDQHLGLGNDFGGLFDEFGFHVKRSR